MASKKSKKSKKGAPAKTPTAKTPRSKTPSTAHRVALKCEDYFGEPGNRVLACGDGPQCGHPGRSMSRKARKVDIVEDLQLQVVQVAAGGVHSLLLTSLGQVFTCGSNEHGAVPVADAGELVDEFTLLTLPTQHGKVVSVAAGAAFSAALTADGSVIAWGWLRSSDGRDVSHPLAQSMQREPTLLLSSPQYKAVTMAAGENHLVLLTSEGKLMTFGDSSMGQVGRARGTDTMRTCRMGGVDGQDMLLAVRDPDSVRYKHVSFRDVFASGYWSAALANDGRVFVHGLNNFHQLAVDMGKAGGEEKEADGDRMGGASESQLRIMRPTHASLLSMVPRCMSGVQHCHFSSSSGQLFGVGKNVDNVLGFGNWRGKDDKANERVGVPQLVSSVRGVAGVSAGLDCSMAWTTDGAAFSWGFDSCGQLGLGTRDDDDDEKIVPVPRRLQSAHLDGFRVVSVSMADNHCLILAKRE